MMKLTRSAKRAYVGLMCANLFVILGLLPLYHYYSERINHPIPLGEIRSLTHLVNQLQKSKQERWPVILKHYKNRWTYISLSPKPQYQNNTLLALHPSMLLDLIKKNHQLELSVFVDASTWLNIKITPPQNNTSHLFISMLFVLLFLLFIVNYFIVKTLNQPIITLIESLEDTQLLEHWSPIPLTGNADQQAILKRVNQLQKKVHQLLANRTKVVTAISHDLRTPLTRLKLRAEYIEDARNHHKIMNDLNEMELMIKDILDYFQDIHRIEQPQRFDLISLLQSIYQDTLDSNMPVTFSSEIQKLVYTGSVNLLKRALINIISNATYYGHAALINVHHDNNFIYITITDQGAGLKNDELELVFTPFYRSDTSRSRTTGGTGLGLTIAKEIIEMHDGFITLTNNEDKGLKVLVKLPKKRK